MDRQPVTGLCVELVRLLLEAGANPNGPIPGAPTPLQGCLSGILGEEPRPAETMRQILASLLAAGADLTQPGSDGIRPLALAGKIDDRAIIKMLNKETSR